MEAELTIREILDLAGEELQAKRLQPVTKRTLDYWISIGLIDHPRRKGKAGLGLFSEHVKDVIVCIRELQERFNFTLADIRMLLSSGSQLDDALNLMIEVEETYGPPVLPYARLHVSSNHIGPRVKDQAADFYIALRVSDGDEELNLDEVARRLELDTDSVRDLALSHQLPSHGETSMRFLGSEVFEWKASRSTTAPDLFAQVMARLIDLTNEVRRIDTIDSVPEKSREWLAYWIDALDTEFWRLRRLYHEAEMRQMTWGKIQE
jgi:DNA-binding transcriptional MerR regulator